MRRERGFVLIIAYKLVKGVLWLGFALVIAVLVLSGAGVGDRLLEVAAQLRHHSHAWSLELAGLLVRAATRRGLWFIVAALAADGVSSLIEGWALWHGRWWGPWLVVVATSTLLPFEIVAILRHPHLSRFVVLAVNGVIALYLTRKALRERRQHAAIELGR